MRADARQPATKLRVPLPAFEVAEYRGRRQSDRRPAADQLLRQRKEGTKTADLLKDVVSNGGLRVEARCLNQEQFLGMARPDLFIRMHDRPFAVGFFKAISRRVAGSDHRRDDRRRGQLLPQGARSPPC